jgi:hypothetical protein
LALNGGKEEFATLEDEEVPTSEEGIELFPPQETRIIKKDIDNGKNDFFIFLLYKIFLKFNASFTP